MNFNINEIATKSLFVETPISGRQLVIPDIHACYHTLIALLEKVNLTKNDQLFLLGDYINRGPNNKGVIDHILNLKQLGYQVYPLRGNHEQMALESYQRRLNLKRQTEPSFRSKRPTGLVDSTGLLFPKYVTFFKNLPYYYELENYFLVHAGFDFRSSHPFSDFETMIWVKSFSYDHRKAYGKTIIRGHVTHTLEEIENSILRKEKIIHLDGGCYKKKELGKGNLCCFDLTNQKLEYQVNVEKVDAARKY